MDTVASAAVSGVKTLGAVAFVLGDHAEAGPWTQSQFSIRQ